MRSIFLLIIIAAAGFKLTTSFMNSEETVLLFSAEINIWLYRAIWLVAGMLSVYAILKKQKDPIHKEK